MQAWVTNTIVLLASEIVSEQSPRPAGESNLASGRLARPSDLGTCLAAGHQGQTERGAAGSEDSTGDGQTAKAEILKAEIRVISGSLLRVFVVKMPKFLKYPHFAPPA